jgi:hypothetical protein
MPRGALLSAHCRKEGFPYQDLVNVLADVIATTLTVLQVDSTLNVFFLIFVAVPVGAKDCK